MKNRRNNMFGINENIVKGIHYFILIGMLHSTFVAPAQNMLIDYYFGSRPISASYTNFEYPSFKDDILEEIVIPDDVNSKPDGQFYSSVQTPKETEVSQVFYADINQGVIGVTEDLPLDSVKDNLFKFSLDKIPADSKVLLKYDLYGLSDTGSVSRSINDMPSTGGHIISKNNSWTPQEEELDRNWVRQGENTILFTAPSISGFGYKIKNVRIEFAKTDSGSFSSALMLNVDSKSLFYKDNTLYIKGFVRDNTEGLRVEVEGNPLSVYKNQFEGLITLTEAIFSKNHILIKAYDNKGLLGQELIVLDNLKEADFFVPYEENVAPSVQLFPAFEKGEFFIDGAGIIIADSALYQTKNISLNSLRKKDIAPLNSGMINVTKAGSAFRFLPDGTKFEKDVKILIAYDSNLIPKGYTEKDIKTYFFNKSSKSWVAVEKDSVDVNNKIIISKTNHFTDYINGIIQVPESPQTSAFIPTMMSDIKAADPSAEMTLISPPDASQKGDANVSYPIKIPAGRNGMQPQLVIQYNNNAGNGWLGQGWDLNIPVITIDTRWGVPVLDDNYETETYTLNGEQLMYPKIKNNDGDFVDWMPNRHYDATSNSTIFSTVQRERVDDAVFTPRKQGSFTKIERKGNNPSTYYWKVTNTDGTISWYGGKDGVVNNSVLKNSEGKVVHWGLYMVEDVFGNNITYEYTNETISNQSGVNANLNGGKLFHVQNIFYTGYQGSNGDYQVVFNTIPGSSGIREDVTIDSRLGVKRINSQLLYTIDVKKGEDLIRQYQLRYELGKFKKYRILLISEKDKNDNIFYNHQFEYYDDIYTENGDVYFSAGMEINICNEEEIEQPQCYRSNFWRKNGSLEIITSTGVVEVGNYMFGVGEDQLVLNQLNNTLQQLFPNCAPIAYFIDTQTIGIRFSSECGIVFNSVKYTAVGASPVSTPFTLGDCYSLDIVQANPFFPNSGSYSFENSFTIGDPDCPSFLNYDFMVDGYVPSFDSSLSVLGSSSSASESIGGYLGIGIGCKWYTKLTTFGMQYTSSKDRTNAMTAMVDINGDGLDDIVLRENNHLYYKPHLIEYTTDENNATVANHFFGTKRPIIGLNNFYKTVGESKSSNFQATFGGGSLGGFVGADNSKTESTTSIYFTDANRDGLIDIVKNGVVYFNRLDSYNNPHFVSDSQGSENLVITAEPMSVEVIDEDEDEIEIPSYDVVKVWEAPADGKIQIENSIALSDTSKEATVTIEMPTIKPRKCYTVTFPYYYWDFYSYQSSAGGYFGGPYEVPCYSIRVKKFSISNNGLVNNYYPTNLYLINGNINGPTSTNCLSTQQIVSLGHTEDNMYYGTKSLDYKDRIINYLTDIFQSYPVTVTKNWFMQNSASLHYTSNYNYWMNWDTTYGYYSTIPGLIIDAELEIVNLSDNSIVDIINFSVLPEWDFTTHRYDFPIKVSINNSLISDYIFYNSDIHDSNTFGLSAYPYIQFKEFFEYQYPNSTVYRDTNAETITITISDTDEEFNTITISSPDGTSSETYNFTEIPCGQARPVEIISSDKNEGRKSYQPTDEEMTLISNLIMAQQNIEELDFEDIHFKYAVRIDEEPYNSQYFYLNKNKDEEYWANDKKEKIVDRNILSKLEEKLPIDIEAIYNNANQENKKIKLEHYQKSKAEAQKWLDDYYKHQQQSDISNYRSFSPTQANCVQTPQDLCLLFGANLNSSNPTVSNIITTASGDCTEGSGTLDLSVKKGDRIYFRVHSVENGNPPVSWNPEVKYVDNSLNSVTDQNGLTVYDSSYSDGFIISAFQPTIFPGNEGTASITWNSFNVANPSDNVTFEIFKRTVVAQENSDDDTVTEELIYSINCPSGVTTTIAPTSALNSVNISINNASNLSAVDFYFKVKSTSNVNWKSIEWNPKITTTTEAQVQGENGPEGSLVSEEVFYPVVDYSIYKMYPCSPQYQLFDASSINDGLGLGIKPELNGVFDSGDDGVIYFVVKNNGKLIGSRTITVNNGSVNINNTSPIPLTGLVGSTIEIGYYKDDANLYDDTPSLLSKITSSISSTVVITYESTTYDVPKSKVMLFQKPSPKYGPMLRQWGQFMYNPHAVQNAISSTYGDLIKEEELIYSQSLAMEVEDAVDYLNGLGDSGMTPQAMENFQQNNFSLYNQAFLTAKPYKGADSTSDRWIGLHGENYASSLSYRAATMNQYFGSEYEVEAYEYQNVLQTGAYAINKLSKGKGKNISGGASIDIGITVGANATKSLSGSSKILTDYADFNGDGYPDIISNSMIQVTNQTGGLKSSQNREGYITTHSSESWGIGASGSYSKGGDDLSGAYSPVKLEVKFEGFKGNSGAGLSGNFSKGQSITNSFWTDINGDGLPDLIQKDETGTVMVYLNNGQGVEATSNNWNIPKLFDGESNNFSGGLGINKWKGSFEAGVSVTSAWNDTENTLIDINGDGLLDYINTEDNISVMLNQGNKLVDFGQEWSSWDMKRESVSVGANLNGTVTAALVWAIPIPLGVLCLKIPAVSISGSKGTTTNKTKKSISDFDNDGYPDLIEHVDNNNIIVRYSNIRRTDMLKSVTNSLGGKFIVDYRPQQTDYGNPHPNWVMSEVIVQDGYDFANDGKDIYRKSFIYENGKYDRREREFYGFETIKTLDYTLDEDYELDELYRTSVTQYYNHSYFLNGMVKETAIYKGEDIPSNLFSKSETEYQMRNLLDDNSTIDLNAPALSLSFDVGGHEGRRSAVVLPVKIKNYIFETGSTPVVSEINMGYDAKGRVAQYSYLGNPNVTSDDYVTSIEYHNDTPLMEKNILNVPKKVEVSVGGTLKRLRKTEDINPGTGAVGTVITHTSSSNNTVTTLKYDQFGNLTFVEYPENENNEKMSYDYSYDSELNKYIVKIKDAFGYEVNTDYNALFDVVTSTQDIADNQTIYEYDNFGRMTLIKGPKEIENNEDYTIKFEYFPKYSDLQSSPYQGSVSINEFVPVALTRHYDPQHENNTIDTYTFIDGLARVVQVKKDIEINQSSNPQDNPDYQEKMSVSGAIAYDEFGRAVNQYHPTYENKEYSINFKYNMYEADYFNETVYDELDRVIQSIDAEGNESFVEYSVENNLHKTRTVVQQTSSVNIISESFKDANGRVVLTNNVGPGGDILTHFAYNAIGELLSYTDDEGLMTSYSYDMLGRRIDVNHPDNGITKYFYDGAGNLTKLQTANLAVQDKYIEYHYEYNRLAAIIFPENQQGVDNISNVYYHYGTPGSGNQSGRLIFQQDASGTQEFEYGNMGEVVHNRRTVVAPSPTLPVRTFDTYFEYDSWNRLQSIFYPDGEKVFYFYNLGGNLNRIQGAAVGQDYNYIERIDYDHFEQRTYLKYGNKTETFYTYTPQLRRLDQLDVMDSNSQNLLKNVYEYDKAGNVTGVVNGATYNTSNYMGGGFDHSYSYDNLNRLIAAKGGFYGHPSQQEMGNDSESGYDLQMKYNTTHGIVVKEQFHDKNGQAYLPNSYIADYKYFEGTHKVKEIIDNNSVTESFDYDFNGNNVLRHKDDTGIALRYYWDEVNRLRIAEEPEVMHHYIYDASGERVLKASSHMEAVYENGELVYSGVQMDNYTTYPSAFLVVNPDGVYSKHYYAGTQRIASQLGETGAEIFEVQQRPSGTEAPAVNYDEIRQIQLQDLTKYLEGRTVTFKKYRPGKEEEEDTKEDTKDDIRDLEGEIGYMAAEQGGLYFYHPDHLGTATFLTDINGLPYEFFLNLPFGETMVEQHSQTEDYINRWKFTGHELDKETGLYYAGARYYDPRTSIWLSVDPLAEKYPSWNPYHYVHQNPINLIDPTGMEADDWIKYKGSSGNTQWIYDSEITTKEKAEAKGYRNVETVAQNVMLYNDNSLEAYQLGDNGSVTDMYSGREVQSGFTMAGGTHIGENNQLKSIASGLQDGGNRLGFFATGLTVSGLGVLGVPLGATGGFMSVVGLGFEIYNDIAGGKSKEYIFEKVITKSIIEIISTKMGRLGKNEAEGMVNESVIQILDIVIDDARNNKYGPYKEE